MRCRTCVNYGTCSDSGILKTSVPCAMKKVGKSYIPNWDKLAIELKEIHKLISYLNPRSLEILELYLQDDYVTTTFSTKDVRKRCGSCFNFKQGFCSTFKTEAGVNDLKNCSEWNLDVERKVKTSKFAQKELQTICTLMLRVKETDFDYISHFVAMQKESIKFNGNHNLRIGQFATFNINGEQINACIARLTAEHVVFEGVNFTASLTYKRAMQLLHVVKNNAQYNEIHLN